MRLLPKPLLGVATVAALSLTGCQKLSYEKTLTLTSGEVQAFPIDAPRSQQKVTVSVTATGSPVNVHVVLESDHAAVMEALTNSKKVDPAKVLASKEKMDSGTVEATVPAKKGFSVLV